MAGKINLINELKKYFQFNKFKGKPGSNHSESVGVMTPLC